MLPSYFDNILVHLRQKARFRPKLSPKFLSALGPNPTRKARADLELWHNVGLDNHSHQRTHADTQDVTKYNS